MRIAAWGEGWGEGELAAGLSLPAKNVLGMRETEPQILAALDILVRRWAFGLTITQRRTRMSALQSTVPTTSEECEMRPLPLFMKRLTLAVELK